MQLSILKTKKPNQQGFTLVEIAIVLVIIGLLIGGILRGQEMINSARVRSLISQQTAVQSAYYGFIDRYRATPGDLSAPQALLVNAQTTAGVTPGDGTVLPRESHIFFNNLAQAGYLTCGQCLPVMSTPQPTDNTATNSPLNPFGQPIWFNLQPSGAGGMVAGYLFASTTSPAEPGRPMISTGNGVSSSLLSEMDRKVDDGDPVKGTFRHSDLTNGSTLGTAPLTCAGTAGAAAGMWAVNPAGANCQGAGLF